MKNLLLLLIAIVLMSCSSDDNTHELYEPYNTVWTSQTTNTTFTTNDILISFNGTEFREYTFTDYVENQEYGFLIIKSKREVQPTIIYRYKSIEGEAILIDFNESGVFHKFERL